ncbi:helix-turn-helix transcriptional regulator [Pseudomonas putida]|nr:helix-turn-helix transcriptional regulator [Pseudomonas putida]MDD2009598.1 helix-turn-helix transcriptional regulator [Pseudomonas putida]
MRQRMRKMNLTPTDLATRLEVSTQTINNWFSRGIPGKSIFKVALVLEVTVEWLQEGTGEEEWKESYWKKHPRPSNATVLGPIDIWDDETPLDDDEVYVPFLKEVELSAGSGRTVIEQSHKQKLRFGKLTLRKQGVQPDDAVCVTVSGNSMEPVLPDKSTVGVDQGSTAVVDGKMYAIDHDGQLRVKTLYRLPGGGIRMRSFNRDEHPDEEYTAQEMIDQNIHIKGKVFWSSVLW